MKYPRMASDVYHSCTHLFTNYWLADQVTASAIAIKKLILGSSDAPTSYQGDLGKAQLAIQTEFIVSEYSGHKNPEDALALLDQRIDALFEAGFAVHLLLPVHDLPQQGWEGIDWQALAAEWPGGAFDPYQPMLTQDSNGQECPYDILSEKFHKPIIEHLVETGRAEKLAVIYLMNEFAYPENELLDSASNWDNSPDWKNIRAQALANTANRVLEKGRIMAKGVVPVGLKFAGVKSPNTGWTPFEAKDPDQLANTLNIMSENKDILGFDLYFLADDLYDSADKERLDPFLPLFKDGFFELSEVGRFCSGCPGDFNQGSRTSSQDIVGASGYWEFNKGFNLFAWNASGESQGCYALADGDNQAYPGAQDEVSGLWDLVVENTGIES